MPTVTDTIRYNLRDRVRRHRGQKRNFDIPRIVATINGPAVQERVKMRDMHGYLEHTPRIKFGMNPGACQIEGGKMVTIEPAIVTTFLKAYPDGTVEHQAEFLDNPPGQVAERMHRNKVGGFSSAIDEGRPEFYGFDYVSEPNFALNRGYALALDSAAAHAATLDDVEEYNAHVAGIWRLLDSVNTAHASELGTARGALEQALETVARLAAETAELRSMLVSGRTLDAVSLEVVDKPWQRPVLASGEPAANLLAAIEGFGSAPLAGYSPLPAKADKSAQSMDSVFSHFGGRR